MNGRVRLANPADAADIAAMSRDEIEHGLPWSWTEARVLRAIASPEINVAILREARMLVGFGIMSYREDEAHLLLFSVRQSHRRKGIGKALLEWLEQVARDAGIRHILLECRRDNAPARNFYAEHGYHELAISRGYYQGVEDAIRLEKWLTKEGHP
jgi:[ribosomal protein S18]-alanine N-acetyltransferase